MAYGLGLEAAIPLHVAHYAYVLDDMAERFGGYAATRANGEIIARSEPHGYPAMKHQPSHLG